MHYIYSKLPVWFRKAAADFICKWQKRKIFYFLVEFWISCYNFPVTAPILATERGVFYVDSFLSFLVAVMAGVVCHYIIKWLDSDD